MLRTTLAACVATLAMAAAASAAPCADCDPGGGDGDGGGGVVKPTATTLETAVMVAAAPVTNPHEGGQQGTGEQTPAAPLIVTPATTPPTRPVTGKPVKKARCKKKVRHVVKRIHGKRRKVKKLVCAKPAQRRR
jgi:hypothetical protein